jgi:hypothetical protein
MRTRNMNVRPTARPALFDFPLLGVGAVGVLEVEAEGETVPGTVRVGVEGEVTVGDRVTGGIAVDGNSDDDIDGEGTMDEGVVVIDDVITVVLTATDDVITVVLTDEKSDGVRVGSMTETVEELLADCPATQAARNTTKIEAMLGPARPASRGNARAHYGRCYCVRRNRKNRPTFSI